MTDRTNLQNASLHLYLEWVADGLADSGQDMRTVIKVPIRPTKDNVKELMFRPVCMAMYPIADHPELYDKKGVIRTSKLSTTQMQECYEQFNLILADRFGIGFDWPSEESLRAEQ